VAEETELEQALGSGNCHDGDDMDRLCIGLTV
jgi:hypothetical protein